MLHTSANPHESRRLSELLDFARGLHRPSTVHANASGAAHEEDLLASSYFTAVCTAMFKEDRIPKADRFLLFEVLLAMTPSVDAAAASSGADYAPVYASRAAAFEAERLEEQKEQEHANPAGSSSTQSSSLATCVRRAVAGLHAWVPPAAAAAATGDGDAAAARTDTPRGYVAELEGLTAYVCSRLGVTDAQHVAFIVVAVAQSLYHEYSSTASPVAGASASSGKKRGGKGQQGGAGGDATAAVNIPAARFAPTAPAPGWAERVFRVVYALQARFPSVPPHPDAYAVSVELLRLLLQYHDPTLSMHLDRCKVNAAGHVLSAWGPSLCALLLADPAALAACDAGENATTTSGKWDERDEYHEAAPFLSLIDFVLASRDPVVLPALCIEVLRRNRDRLLALQSKAQLLEAFGRIRLDPTSTDVRVLAVHGQQQLRMTPKSVCAMLHRALFQDAVAAAGVNSIVAGVTSAGGVSGSEMSVAGADGIFSVRDQAERLKSFIALPVTTGELVETFGAATAASPQDETPPASFVGPTAAAAAAAVAAESPSASRRTSPQDRVGAAALVLRSGAVSAQPSLQYHPKPLSFVILDCRAERSFNFARLPTAIHVGTNVGYDPALMRSMVERFEGARGSHLCLLGTGRGLVEEANLLKIIALQFLQHGFPFVSIAEGGFQGLIPHIRAGEVEVVRTVDEVAGPSQTDAAQPSSPLSTSRGRDDGPAHNAEELAHKAKEKASALADEAKEKAAALAEEAKQTAEVAKAKISQNLEAAKSWGLSLFSRLGKQDGPAPAATPTVAPAAAATKPAAAAAPVPVRPNSPPGPAPPSAPSGPAAFAAAAVNFFSAADTHGREELSVTPTVPAPLTPGTSSGQASPRPNAAAGVGHARSVSGASAGAAATVPAATPFHAGGADNEEDDDDDLMATLVSTVPKPKAPESKAPEPPAAAVSKPDEAPASEVVPTVAAEAEVPIFNAAHAVEHEEPSAAAVTPEVPSPLQQQHVDPTTVVPVAAAAVEAEPSPLLSGDVLAAAAATSEPEVPPQAGTSAPVEVEEKEKREVEQVAAVPLTAAVEVDSPAQLPDVAPSNPLTDAAPAVASTKEPQAPAAPAAHAAAEPHPFDDMFD